MVQFKKAQRSDAEALAGVSERAFHNDVHYGAPGIGGPPGYNAAAWQAKMMRVGEYYKIVLKGQIVGGFRLSPGDAAVRIGADFRRAGFSEPGAWRAGL